MNCSICNHDGSVILKNIYFSEEKILHGENFKNIPKCISMNFCLNCWNLKKDKEIGTWYEKLGRVFGYSVRRIS